MVNIGVTGANGFVGTYVIDALKKEGFNPISFDRNGSEGLLTVALLEFAKDKDYIFHLAGVNRSENETDFTIGNVDLTRKLLNAMIASGKESKIIYASTFQVYGDSEGPISEDSKTVLNNIYAKTKFDAEQLIVNSGVDHAIFRISNIYGPGCKPYYNSVVATFIDLMKNKKKLTIHGTGEQLRDYIFVSDVATGLLKGISIKPGIYNLCSGEMLSINNVVKNIEKALGEKAEIEILKTDEKLINFRGINQKLMESGWEPKVKFEEGIKKCL